MKQNRFNNQAFIDRLNSDDIESESELIEFMAGFALAVKEGRINRVGHVATAVRARIARYKATQVGNEAEQASQETNEHLEQS